jgi:hypothetical protein
MADLDGDGFLTRDEFSWFTLRTEGAEVDDDKWQVVQGTICFAPSSQNHCLSPFSTHS